MRHAIRSRTSMMYTAIGCLAMVVMGWVPLAFVQGAEIAIEAAPGEEVQTGDVLTIEVASETDENARPPAATPQPAPNDGEKISAVATHHQTGIIKVDAPGQSSAKIACFCLTPDDKILAGCAASSGEVRVFDHEGKFLENWSAPFKPEAIFARADGKIFLAGEGQVATLSANGKVELTKKAPHAAALVEHPEKLREQVIAQAKQQAEMFGQQTKQYDQMIERADKQIESVKAQIAELAKSTEKDSAENAQRKKTLELRIAMFERQKKQYDQAKEQFATMIGGQGKLTDAQIDEQVKASMVYKLKAASISATKDDVFLATPTAAGYGFAIWRMDNKLESPSKIVDGLSGCCGQMDVKANDKGVFVAENSRHRVVRYDRDGKQQGAWGASARTGLEGFGSCCNPMNVAFGPKDVVYTAEDDTGRIKRYSPEGKLLGLVGNIELKPGCKNVSIAVSSDGSRVYMMDITRNHLVRMDPRPADEVAKEEATGKTAQVSGSPPQSGFGQVLKAIFTTGE